MPLFDPQSFSGTLSGHGVEVPVVLHVTVDDRGALEVVLEPLSRESDAFAFMIDERPGDLVDMLSLRAVSQEGWRLSSDRFHVTTFGLPSDGGIDLQGACVDAELARDLVNADQEDVRIWFVRRLGTFHGIERDTRLGRLVVAGRPEKGEGDVPACGIALHAGAQELDGWWDDSERLLRHMCQVLSFACDSYLVPVYEHRARRGEDVYRFVSRGPTSQPHLPPFDMLYMDQILDCAARSFEDRAEAVARLDPAIRWLTASAVYEETRLINAMSAIESILAIAGLPELFMEADAFESLQKKVRTFLKGEGAPFGMRSKTAELNRRSLREKLEALLDTRGIVRSDLDQDWMTTLIRARNLIVHTGVAPERPDQGGHLFPLVVQAREVVTRIVLSELGFEGQYRSWLHGDQYLEFPSCRPISEVAAERQAIQDGAAHGPGEVS